MSDQEDAKTDGSSASILRASDVSKRFGGVVALNNVEIEIAPQEVAALVGDNGAGKSTLVNILSGVMQPTSGYLSVDGVETEWRGPADARRAGIETMYQNLAIVDQLDAVANLFLGRERFLFTAGPLSFLDKRGMAKEAREVLERTGVNIPSLREPMRNLSGGQRQSVALARAAGWGSKLIIMDEPTAALGVQETSRVEEIIARLRTLGVAALIVTHNLRQVFTLADTVWVLRRGRMVGHLRVAECKPNDVVRLITGADEAAALDFV